MLRPLFILSALAGIAMAGTPSSKEVIPAAPEPALWAWFVGGSAGYFFDQYEEEYYTGHIGVVTPLKPGGWDVSIFLEGLYTNPEDSDEWYYDYYNKSGGSVAKSHSPKAISGYNVEVDSDLEIIPVTLNVKFEKELAANFAVFAGAGLGVAFVDLEQTTTTPWDKTKDSSDDVVFAAQVFAGVGYNITSNLQVYSQARWLYLDDADKFNLTDDFGGELGLRFKF